MEWARIERERERGSGESVCVAEALSAIINCIQSLPCAEWWRRRAQRCASAPSTIQVSRPDHTKHVAAHVVWCQEKTHPVGRFPTSHIADPPQRRWMYNAVIFDLVKYVPHCCSRRHGCKLCYVWCGRALCCWLNTVPMCFWMSKERLKTLNCRTCWCHLSNLTWSTARRSQRPLHVTA